MGPKPIWLCRYNQKPGHRHVPGKWHLRMQTEGVMLPHAQEHLRWSALPRQLGGRGWSGFSLRPWAGTGPADTLDVQSPDDEITFLSRKPPRLWQLTFEDTEDRASDQRKRGEAGGSPARCRLRALCAPSSVRL